MTFGIRAMLVATPRVAAALHLVSHKSPKSRPPTEVSTSKSGVVATTSGNPVSRAKSNAKALFHKCTANVFHREKEYEYTVDTSDSETSLALPSNFTSSIAKVDPVGSNIDYEIDYVAASSDYSAHSARNSNVFVYRASRTTTSSNISSATPPPKDRIADVDATHIILRVAFSNANGVLPEPQDPLAEKNCDKNLQVTHCNDGVLDQTNTRPKALNSTHKVDVSPTLMKKFKTQLKGLFKFPTIHEREEVESCRDLANITPTHTDENEDQEDTGTEDDGALANNGGWTQVRAIPNEKYCKLVLGACDPHRKVKPNHIAVVGHCEGAFHRVTFVRFYRDSKFENFVVRVPAHGTSELWTKQDSYMMEREVDLMRYVRHHTKTPVAQVFDHDTDRDNALGMPYIVEARIEGTPAYKIWFHEGENYHPEVALREGDHPSKETEKKRVNFLLSLAHVMNELGTLNFDRSGSLVAQYTRACPQTASTGPHYTWTSVADPGKPNEHLPGSSTQDIIQGPLDDFCNIYVECAQRGARWHRDTDFCRRVGMRKVLDMVFFTPAFNQAAENFTIWHPDLDLQNILTDEDGNVTGIIDWDGAFLAPRCMGASSVPKFLNRDWFPEEVGGLYSFPNLIWRSDYYRSIYAAAMIRKAPMQEHPDGHFIMNSAIYTSALSGVLKLNGGGDVEDFVTKLLQSISRLNRIPVTEYLVELGRGMAEEEELLKHDIAIMLEPQLPEDKYFKLLHSITEPSTSSSTPSSIDGVEATSRDSYKAQFPEKDVIIANEDGTFLVVAEPYEPTLDLPGKHDG